MRLKNCIQKLSFIFIMLMISLTVFSVNNTYTLVKAEEKTTTKKVWNYDYTGDYQIFVAPYTAKYKIELWGAEGFNGNNGAYTSGYINLKKGQRLYVYVGQGGYYANDAETFNGGWGTHGGRPGGGATDVRLEPGEHWSEFYSTKSRIMVAAGSGVRLNGTDIVDDLICEEDLGYGGALEGAPGGHCYIESESYNESTGGTQTSVGEKDDYPDAAFGYANGGEAGGNGYYPGGAARFNSGGGSSFISGYEGCDAISEESEDEFNIIHTGQSVHYSGLSFENPVMIAGNETQPTHPASEVEIGEYDGENGYAVITAILSEDNDLSELKVDNGTLSPSFDSTKSEYTLTLGKYDIDFTLSGKVSDEKSTVIGLDKKYIVGLGETKIVNVLVTSESGDIKTYKITATRGNFSGNEHSSKLSKLEINDDVNNINFHPEKTEYDITIPKNIIDLEIITETFDNEATVKIEGNRYLKNDTGTITIKVTEANVQGTTYTINYTKNEDYSTKSLIKRNYDYIGDYQTFVAPITGIHKIELWGAQGFNGNNGAYTSGYINLKKGQRLYVYVGQGGYYAADAETFNGGWSTNRGIPAGGATDVRLVEGYWSDFNSTKSRIMVAAGSGTRWSGLPEDYIGDFVCEENVGYGGALEGTSGGLCYNETENYDGSKGGTQTSVGETDYPDYPNGEFGYANGGNAGGNGYYPGGSAALNSGGGSSFISGYEGCDAISEESEDESNIIHTGQSIHYSGLLFENPVMIAGNETQPIHPASEVEIGEYDSHDGKNGYAVITTILSLDNYLSELKVDNGTLEPSFNPTISEYNLTLGKYDVDFTLSGKLSDEKSIVTGLEKYTVDPGDTKTVNVVVTSESGDIKTYSINVTREGLSENEHSSKLSKLEINDDVNNINFHPEKTEYDITIPKNIIDLEIITETFDNEATVKIEGNRYLKNDTGTITIKVTELNVQPTTYTINYTKGSDYSTKTSIKYNYDYIGDYQIFTAPITGIHKIELWGAQGFNGNNGAYTSGYINLNKGQELYVYVGQGGFEAVNSTSFNGGTGTHGGFPGGGATDVRLDAGSWYDFYSLKSRIMVAAGSGSRSAGLPEDYTGDVICEEDLGYGGALEGPPGGLCYNDTESYEGSTGGTQTSPGEKTYYDYADSGFGYADGGHAGGNGYYGAGGAEALNSGGGSSFISGCEGCDAISEESTEDNIIHTGQGIHYSGLYFENPVMIAGNETQPSHPTSEVEVGGYDGENGYAVITAILSSDNYLSELKVDNGTLSPSFNPTKSEYTLTLGKYDVDFTLSGTLSDEKSKVSGFGKYDVNLNETKTVNVLVTSESGDVKTYKITATRGNLSENEHSSKLSKLEIENYKNALEPNFHPLTEKYSISIISNQIDLNIKTETFDDEATVKIEGNKYLKNEAGIITITVSEPHSEDTIYEINYNKVNLESEYNFDYTGNEQVFSVPVSGYYKLETWGAQGGTKDNPWDGDPWIGGYAGYSKGLIYLNKTNLYINVGGQGESSWDVDTHVQGGYNGGGFGYTTYGDSAYSSGGGGATHIATKSGLLNTLENNINSILIVSGGGSGVWYYSSGYYTPNMGYGGGFIGSTGVGYAYRNQYFYAQGGTQTETTDEDAWVLGSFGQGANQYSKREGPGAGGGFYGGNASVYSAGGGSGYIGNPLLTDKAMYCHGCEESEEEDTRTIYTENISEEPISEYAKIGNGYAKITPIIPKSDDNYLTSLTSDYGTLSPGFDPIIEEYTLTLGKYDTYFTLSGTLSDSKASVTGLDKYKLKFGETKKINVVVTSESGEIRTYIVNTTREKLKPGEHSSKLSKLNIEGYEDDLEPEFHPLTNEYEITVMPNEIDLVIDAESFDEEANIKIEGNRYIKSEAGVVKVTVTEPHSEPTIYTIRFTKAEIEPKYTYECTETYKEYVVPASGVYTIELWGAIGGSGVGDGYWYRGGFGGYTKGDIKLSRGQKLYIYVGCSGGRARATGWFRGGVGGYNGGAKGGDDTNQDSNPDEAGGGGGATDVRLEINKDGEWWDFNSLKSRIMVAGGGGGGAGHGYGYAGGWPLYDESKDYMYAFGYGQTGANGRFGNGGGGGGYYGGTAYSVGQGGLSYISGFGLNDAIDKNSTEENVILKDSNIHYSGLYFTNTKMIDGDGYEYKVETDDDGQEKITYSEESVGMPDADGNIMTGNGGDGYAQITPQATKSKDNYLTLLQVKNESGEIKPLNPEFEIINEEYEVNLGVNETEIKIEARPSDDLAVIDGLGTHKVPSGNQEFNVTVTAESGDIRIYTIKTNRKASSESKAKNIIITGLVPSICEGWDGYCVLDSEFDPNTNTYKMTVPSGIRDLEFTVEKSHYYQTVTGDGVKKLGRDLNTIEIIVTSEDGVNTSKYTYEITRDMTGDNYIDTLEVIKPEVDIDFHYLVTEYSFKVDNEVTSLEMNIKLDDENASYKVIGNENFKVGNNIVEIEVTAENEEVRSYILNVYRLSNGNPLLESLTVTDADTSYTLSPEFKDITTNYTLTVENDITEVYVEGIAKEETTSVEGNDYYELKTGLNEINIITTAEDGTIENYKIIITRKKSSNNYISYLGVDEGELEPEFDRDTPRYSITVDPYTKKLNIEVELEDETSKYEIIGNSNFKIGNNLVTIKVTAEDGSIKNYYIDVEKEGSDNNYLSSLNVNEGELDPEFDPEEKEYTVNVSNEVTQIKVSGTKEDTLSKVSGFGTYNLSTGDNKIKIRVTSETGKTRDYIVKVYRELNSDSSLSDIIVSEGLLNPEFDPEEKEYTVNVSNEISSIEVIGIPNVATTKVEGNGLYPLLTGENEITIKGISEDGNVEEYKVVVVRDESSNANLSFLLVKEGILSPSFDKMTINYEVKVPNDVLNVNVIAEAERETSEISITGNTDLEVGENTVNVLVTAEDGNIKTYEIKVIREEEAQNNLDLKTLDLTSCTLTPDFSGNNQYYECEVPYEVTSTHVSANAEDESNTIEGTGDKNLKVGKNVVGIRVTNTDGLIKDYQVLVIRKKSTESRLSNILIDNHVLNETFNPDIEEYSVTTKNNSLNINPIKMHEDQSIEIIGNKNFTIGLNEVQIKVTSPDKNHTSTYTLTVLKEKSDNNYLKNLYVEGYTISPSFNKGTLEYNLEVENDINSIVVRGEKEDSNATLSGLGMHTLEKGLNEIKITVTSQSGVSKEYIINVTRLGSRNNNLSSLSVKDYEIKPEFNKGITNYNLEVEYETSEVEILAEVEEENATISGDGIRILKQGLNKLSVVVTSENGDVKTYYINVTRKDPITSLLKNIKVKNYGLDRVFKSEETEYSVTIDNEVTSLDLIITKLDPNSSYVVEGNENFEVGLNEVKIISTSSDEKETTTYTLLVNRQSYSNTYLSALSVSGYEIIPKFNKTNLNYEVKVPYDEETVTIYATPDNITSKVSGNGEITLSGDETITKVLVTSTGGITRTYIININRLASSNAELKSITSNIGTLTKLNEGDYELIVPKGLEKVTKDNFTVVPEDSKASVIKQEELSLDEENKLYKITIISPDGNNMKEYIVHVKHELGSDSRIKELTPSTGELTPSFSMNGYNYTLNVRDTIDEVSFDVTLNEETSSILNNNLLFELEGYSTPIKITVQAEDGSTSIYNITVEKSITTEKYLENIEITGVTDICEDCILPVFEETNYNYSMTVPYEVSSFDFKITKKHKNQIVKVYKDNIEVSEYTLDVGINNYKVEVQNSLGDKTEYNYVIERLKNTNNYLSSLKLLSPEYEFIDFDKEKLEYSVQIPYEYERIEVEAIPEDAKNAKVKIEGYTYLLEGNNDVKITVTAQNKDKREYIIHVLRTPESNNLIKTLTVSSGDIYELTPRFTPGINDYTLKVPNVINRITIEAIPDLETTKITGDIGEHDLKVGTNKFIVEATSEEKQTRTYVITITRLSGMNTYLEKLIVKNGTMKETFRKEKANYEVEIGYNISELDLELEPEDKEAIVDVIGNENLHSGENIVQIKVRSRDLAAARIYTLKVIKEKSPNNNLSSLSLDGKEIKGFNPSKTEYNDIVVENDKTTINIDAVLEDKNAVIKGKGIYSLEEGENTITITVIAENGEEKEYTINITRKLNTYLREILTDRGEVKPKFDKNTLEYSIEVEEDIKDIIIKGIPEDENAVVEGNGKYELNTSNKKIVLLVTNGEYKKEYIVNVTRKGLDNCNLKYLTVGESMLTPVFDKGTYEYEVTIPYDKTNLSLDYAPEIDTSVADVIGNENLKQGDKVVIRVTSINGKTKDYTITVNKEDKELYSNNLIGLEVEPGTLEPDFDMDYNLYKVIVGHDVEEITVRATRESTDSIVLGTGPHKLVTGRNEIPVQVISKDGKRRTYTIIVTKEGTNDARLKTLEFEDGRLTPAFNKTIEDYTLIIPSDTELIKIKNIQTVDPDATYDIDGDMLAIEDGSRIKIIVLSADKSQTKEYNITLKLEKSGNVYLRELIPSIGEISPTFDKTKNPYEVRLEKDVNSIYIKATPESKNAQVDGNKLYILNDEVTYINITVTAENGNTNVYVVKVIRGKSSNNNLKSLSVRGYTLSPAFSNDNEKQEYRVIVPNEVTSVKIDAIPEDPNAKVIGDDKIDLSVGLNTESIVVTSEDGSTKTYIVKITREEMYSSKIKSLEIEEGVLTPNFDSYTYEYGISIPNEFTSITPDIKLIEDTARYEILNNENLKVGSNEIQIKVKSSNKDIEDTIYTITVVRLPLTNNYLSNIITDKGTLSPAFEKGNLNYTVTLDNSEEEITITALPELTSTKVLGEGTYRLDSGENIIILTGVSESGIERNYKVKVIREYNSNNYLSSLIVSVGSLNPEFDKEEGKYEVLVPEGTNTIEISGTKEDERANVSGFGVYSVEVGSKVIPILVTAENGLVRQYEITVIRNISSNTNIINLIPSTGTLSPSFDNEVDEYELKVDKDTNIVDFDVELESAVASITGNKNILIDKSEKEIKIIVTAEDGSQRTITINIIRESAVLDILLEDDIIQIGEGEEYQINATIVPDDALNKELEYISSDNEIVDVDENGKVTGNKIGSTTIIIRSKDNENIEKTLIVKVVLKKIKSNIYSLKEKEEGQIIIGMDLGLTMKDLKGSLLNDESTIKIYDIEDNEITDDLEIVKTGQKIKLIIDDVEYDNAIVIVRGDINGDGKINVTDKSLMQDHILLKNLIEDYRKYAADINMDDSINVTDKSSLTDYILLKISTLN